jgi:hypothetical protein
MGGLNATIKLWTKSGCEVVPIGYTPWGITVVMRQGTTKTAWVKTPDGAWEKWQLVGKVAKKIADQKQKPAKKSKK